MLRIVDESNFKFNNEYVAIIGYSYLTFLTLFVFICPKISAKIFSTIYPRLSSSQKIEWNNRLTSTIFALIVSTMCSYILIIDKGLSASPLLYESELVKTNISIVIGYVLYDLTIMVLNFRMIGDFFTIFHHFLSLFGYYNSLTYSVMPYFANFRLLVEFSTPLVNMRWFLYACGYRKDSLHFFLNGISMTLVFFLARVMMIPVFWFKVYSVIDSPLWLKLKYFRHIMVVTCFFLDIINIYWFKKMFKGALIVWSTNWQYFEKYHKTQQIEKIKSKIVNNFVYQSTLNGLNLVANPGRFIGIGFMERLSLPKIVADVFRSRDDAQEDQ